MIKITGTQQHEQEEETISEEGEAEKINAILSSNDVSGGFIRISRRGKGEVKFANVDKVPTDGFDIDSIGKAYGGGDYKCQTFKSTGRFYKMFEFSVDERIKGSIDVTPTQTQDNSLLLELIKKGDKQPDNSVMVQMMKMASDSGNQMLTVMMTMMAAQQQASQQNQTNQMNMIMAMMGQKSQQPDIMPILLAMINKGGGSGITEALTALTQCKDIFGGGAQPEEEGILTKLIKAVAPLGPSLIQAMAGSGQRIHRPQTIPTQVQTVEEQQLPEHQSIEEEPNEESEDMLQLLAMLQRCVKAAERNSNPELYAALIEDELPEKTVNDLKTVLTTDEWFELVSSKAPSIKPHRDWFNELRDILLSPIEDEQPTEPEHTGIPSTQGNPVSSGRKT